MNRHYRARCHAAALLAVVSIVLFRSAVRFASWSTATLPPPVRLCYFCGETTAVDLPDGRTYCSECGYTCTVQSLVMN